MTRQEIPPWVTKETEKKKRRPKAPPKPKPPAPRLHVKVNLTGSVEFDLEGPEAAKLVELLKGMKLDEVIEFVDPWASGAEIRYDVEVEDLIQCELWEANEAAGIIELKDPWRF